MITTTLLYFVLAAVFGGAWIAVALVIGRAIKFGNEQNEDF
jgi:hypothetical protein